MRRAPKTQLVIIVALIVNAAGTNAQGIRLGEVILISASPLKKEAKPEEFEACIKKIAPAWNKKNPAELQFFRADRGGRKGEVLLVCAAAKEQDRSALGADSPFTDNALSPASAPCRPSDFLSDPGAYTEYRLIGAEKFKSAPVVGILGVHYIKVKKDRSQEFEKFVVDKLHPAVGHLFPDLQLLYYKSVAGENTGSYITIFALASMAARDKYWPGGKDAEILKQSFKPLTGLAKELGPYLEEGSYLEPTTGAAAAYFESRQWTDFVIK